MSTNFPTNLPTKLRACKICSVLCSQSSFRTKGCPNCITINKTLDFTSSKFKGIIGLVDPDNSWVAKWQRINTNKKGLYAITVEGDVNEEILIDFEKSGGTYYDRNESFKL